MSLKVISIRLSFLRGWWGGRRLEDSCVSNNHIFPKLETPAEICLRESNFSLWRAALSVIGCILSKHHSDVDSRRVFL